MAAAAVLADALRRANESLNAPLLPDVPHGLRVAMVAEHRANRAVCRLVLACALAKAHNPALNPLKPYTEIGGADCFSGRVYDEADVGPFVTANRLPCNSTTAFLTSALRNRSTPFQIGQNLAGNDPALYDAGIALLDAMATGTLTARDLLAELVRRLLLRRNEDADRLAKALADLKKGQPERTPLSSSAIASLIGKHLSQPRSSRLPVLVVKAAYDSITDLIREGSLPLRHHNAADRQTTAIGDLEIVAESEGDHVVTAYEMKDKPVSIPDINEALRKVAGKHVDNYIFVTTGVIDPDVLAYAERQYAELGVEVTVLGCLGFVTHFVHFFHRRRDQFLDNYQDLVLAEPESAVGSQLKEVWLALRKAAEVLEDPSIA